MQSQLSLFVASLIVVRKVRHERLQYRLRAIIHELSATAKFKLQSPGGDNKQVPGEDACHSICEW